MAGLPAAPRDTSGLSDQVNSWRRAFTVQWAACAYFGLAIGIAPLLSFAIVQATQIWGPNSAQPKAIAEILDSILGNIPIALIAYVFAAIPRWLSETSIETMLGHPVAPKRAVLVGLASRLDPDFRFVWVERLASLLAIGNGLCFIAFGFHNLLVVSTPIKNFLPSLIGFVAVPGLIVAAVKRDSLARRVTLAAVQNRLAASGKASSSA